jgi:cell division protein FtsB
MDEWQTLIQQRDSLLRENTDLKSNVDLLRGESDRLRQENKYQTTVIEKLQEANNVLKLTVEELRKENEQLKQQNRELKDELALLQEKLDNTNAVLADVRAELAIMKNKATLRKIIIAIQDMNSQDKLETSYRYLARLRSDRVDDSHYIQYTDSEDVQAYKRKLLRYRLEDAKKNSYIAGRLVRYSTTLFQDPDDHLSQSSSACQLSETDKEDIEEWWL